MTPSSPLQLLRFIPNFIHFGESHVVHAAALFACFLLDVLKTLREFLIGCLHGIFGDEFLKAGGIDEGEHKIAEFFLRLFRIIGGDFDAEFGEFFL